MIARLLLGWLGAGLLTASAIAAPAPLLGAGHIFVNTTAAQINAQSWDTSHAGTPLPVAVKNGQFAVVQTDAFNEGATCPTIIDESQVPNAQTPLSPWYIETSAEGGNAGTQFVNKTTALANGNLTCAAGNLQMTINIVGGIPNGVRVVSHSYGDPNGGPWNTQGQPKGTATFGYFEIQFTQPVLAGTPTPPNCPWFAFWTINKMRSTTWPIMWFENDFPETCSGSPQNPYTIMANTADFHPSPQQVFPLQLQTEIKNDVHQTFTLYDGQPHTLGVLVTHDYIIDYTDGLETQRFNIASMGDDMRLPTMLRIDQGLHDWNSDASFSVTLTVTQATVYSAPPGSCYVLGGC